MKKYAQDLIDATPDEYKVKNPKKLNSRALSAAHDLHSGAGDRQSKGDIRLPPLKSNATNETASRQPRRAGVSTNVSEAYSNTNPLHDRVLFPTQVKQSFLERNRHLINPSMKQMASGFAMKQLSSANLAKK